MKPLPPELAAFARRLAAARDDWPGGGDMMVVVAHPDDETIGLGGQLRKLRDITIVHVTDGAPRDGFDASANGFASVEDYAAARKRELEAAMAEAGIPASSLFSLGVADQDAPRRIAEIATRLADLFATRKPHFVLTHPFEGGHPDHDATALAVWAACRLIDGRGTWHTGPQPTAAAGAPPPPTPPHKGEGDHSSSDGAMAAAPAVAPGGRSSPPPCGEGLGVGVIPSAAASLGHRRAPAPTVIEMASYHLGPKGAVWGHFAGGEPELMLPLTSDDAARKRRMMAAHESQTNVLARFGADEERFRLAPAYDVSVLPNGGHLLYESQGWGLSGPEWLVLSGAALAELGLPAGLAA